MCRFISRVQFMSLWSVQGEMYKSVLVNSLPLTLHLFLSRIGIKLFCFYWTFRGNWNTYFVLIYFIWTQNVGLFVTSTGITYVGNLSRFLISTNLLLNYLIKLKTIILAASVDANLFLRWFSFPSRWSKLSFLHGKILPWCPFFQTDWLLSCTRIFCLTIRTFIKGTAFKAIESIAIVFEIRGIGLFINYMYVYTCYDLDTRFNLLW